jgi:predicted nuclease of restriction endonuclease-like (RecB) superfamily
MVAIKQDAEGWGASVIPRLALDLHNDLPEVKGFSKRNIGRMIAFFRAYPGMGEILPQPVAKLSQQPGQRVTDLPQAVAKTQQTDAMACLLMLVPKIPWGHNILLMEKVKELPARQWYIEQILENGWSRAMLSMAIQSHTHDRQGAAVTNFDTQLPQPHAQLAQDTLKDPYIFDFLTLDKPFRERELEAGLVDHLERFLLELGAGFAFVGRT